MIHKFTIAFLVTASLSWTGSTEPVSYGNSSIGLCSSTNQESASPAFYNGFCPAFTKIIASQSHKQPTNSKPRIFVADPPDQTGTMTIRAKRANSEHWVFTQFQLFKPQMSVKEMQRAGKQAAIDLLPSPPRKALK